MDKQQLFASCLEVGLPQYNLGKRKDPRSAAFLALEEKKLNPYRQKLTERIELIGVGDFTQFKGLLLEHQKQYLRSAQALNFGDRDINKKEENIEGILEILRDTYNPFLDIKNAQKMDRLRHQ